MARPPPPTRDAELTATIQAVTETGCGRLAVGYQREDVEQRLVDDLGDLRAYFSAWVDAGAGVLLAPTLRATPAVLKPLGLAAHSWEINCRAVEILREVSATSSRPPRVAAQIGPAHVAAPPACFDRAYVQYHEQVKPLMATGVDLVILRRIADPVCLKAALVAVRELWNGPVLVVAGPPVPGGAAVPGAGGFSDATLRLLHSFDVGGLGVPGSGSPGEWGAHGDRVRRGGFPLALADLGAAALVPDHAGPLAPGEGSLGEARRALRHGIDMVILEESAPPETRVGSTPATADGIGPAGPDPPRAGAERDDPGMANRATAGTPAQSATLAIFSAGSLEELARFEPGPVQGTIPGAREELFVGFSLEEGSAVDPYRLEATLRDLELRSGSCVGFRSSDPHLLEVCSKAARATALLVVDGGDPDLESCLYLARRYGTGVVLPLGPGDALPGALPARELRGRIETAIHGLEGPCEDLGLARETLYLELSPPFSLERIAAPETVTALEGIRDTLGVRWAVTLEPDPSSPATGDLGDLAGLRHIDLLILRY